MSMNHPKMSARRAATGRPSTSHAWQQRLWPALIAAMTMTAGHAQETSDGLGLAAAGLDESAVANVLELQQLRGKFTVAGIELELGARVRTLIDGRQIFESILEPFEGGLRLGSSTLTGQGEQSASSQLAHAVIPVATGSVSIANRVTDQGVVTLLSVEASGQSIRHELSLDITVRNFAELQRSMRAAALAIQTSRSVRP